MGRTKLQTAKAHTAIEHPLARMAIHSFVKSTASFYTADIVGRSRREAAPSDLSLRRMRSPLIRHLAVASGAVSGRTRGRGL